MKYLSYFFEEFNLFKVVKLVGQRALFELGNPKPQFQPEMLNSLLLNKVTKVALENILGKPGYLLR